MQIINPFGQILELPAQSSITVERNNPLFSTDDTFVQDITYPGKAGLTENNKIFIQSGHLVEAKIKVYEIPVQVFVAGYQFYTALFTYKIVNGEIDYFLKVNLGAVVAKMKAATLQDIYTFDPFSTAKNLAAFTSFMRDTCHHPENYPCSFFPVKNERWSIYGDASNSKWLNEWDHEAQNFKIVLTSFNTGIAPFYKVAYILKNIFDYLKLKIEGAYFNSAEFQQIYLYTRTSALVYTIEPSQRYMPAISIIDFLKQLKERLKISLEFNLTTNTVYIETAQSIFDGDCVDISRYIESFEEISTAQQKGYTVTLKVDESDQQENRGTNEHPFFDPRYSLVVGDGETKIEMAVGTLQQVDEEEYSYPIANQPFNNLYDSEVIEYTQIRLLIFKGMKPVSGGKIFPEATAMKLTKKDGDFYRFLSDSKQIVMTAKIPPNLVANFKSTMKLGCVSDKGMFFYAISKKISYTMSDRKTERISVKIEALTLTAESETKVYIDEANPVVPDDVIVRNKFKAYWQPDIHNFTEISVQFVATGSSTNTYGFTPIDSPTDEGGVGGTIGTVFNNYINPGGAKTYQRRLYAPVKPAYYVLNGVKRYFTDGSGYYIFDFEFPSGYFEDKPIWIVF